MSMKKNDGVSFMNEYRGNCSHRTSVAAVRGIGFRPKTEVSSCKRDMAGARRPRRCPC